MSNEDHSYHSSLREKILEHLFVSEVLKYLWRMGRRDIEVSRSEVDSGGYDVVLDCMGVTRHIQLKASYDGAKTQTQKINVSLFKKPSGCVVWIKFDKDALALGPYLFFGGSPGEKLPDLSEFKTAKHTKANAEGIKAERSNHKIVPVGKFRKVDSIDNLVSLLFGSEILDARAVKTNDK
ncbi:MAG: hypothetical protein HYU57_07265 [Micavibrio aeruginosavorus]|nr:hypothetical protein [Micavibrio aeruginosavorus]